MSVKQGKTVIVSKHVWHWEWLALGLVGLFVFSSHIYQDFWETMRHGIVVWDALFDGRLLDFYAYCGGNSGGIKCGSDTLFVMSKASYDFTIYLIFAIWNFPLWLIEHFSGVNIQNSLVAMLYAKSMLLVAAGITGHLVVRITRLVTGTDVEASGLLISYLSSSALMANILIVGQYDVLSLIFILAGVYYYLKNDGKRFLLFFTIAVSMKYFALMYSLPLLCIKEKNLLKIAGKAAISLSLSFAEKALFYIGTVSGNNSLALKLVEYRIFGVPVYCVLYLLLLLYCYFSRVQSDARWFRQTLFVGFVTYVLLYIAAPAYPYWVVLAIPFMTMLVHTSGGLYGLDTLLSELFEDSLLVYSYVYYHWCYSSESVVRGVTYSILGSRHPFPVNMGGVYF
jgi:hypothetical protein